MHGIFLLLLGSCAFRHQIFSDSFFENLGSWTQFLPMTTIFRAGSSERVICKAMLGP